MRQKYRARQAPELKGEFRLAIPLIVSGKPADAGSKPNGGTPIVPIPADFDGNLAGTTWQVRDTGGDSYEWRFLAEGILHYDAGRGLRRNGRWSKSGDKVTVTINDGYAQLDGVVSKLGFTGRGRSTTGSSWTWTASLVP